ncbi:MAG: hypothetical protein FGM31_05650 [Candidatus Methylopumilus sp.]|jgi:hypothetical protein|nr:hypothetical protein [Candidatus Methylopumilus sp.]
MKNIPHKLVFLMNILGVLAWIMLAGLLFPLSAKAIPLNLGLSVFLIYGAIAAVPALTAFVLFKQKHGQLNLIAIIVNFCLVAFFSFSFFSIVLQTNSDSALLITLIIIIIPAMINIYTLKKLRGINL